ncbi:hypothetical protein SLS62_002581 [Diatrype stigma]|uniref:Uncharacterized protein n=1 Tax=Diatrype stigma TaxID=117547 RepID=A0AAN9UU64_9PEZI
MYFKSFLLTALATVFAGQAMAVAPDQTSACKGLAEGDRCRWLAEAGNADSPIYMGKCDASKVCQPNVPN